MTKILKIVAIDETGDVQTISLDELRSLLTSSPAPAPVDPVKPTPQPDMTTDWQAGDPTPAPEPSLAGEPRNLVGERAGNHIYLASIDGVDRLIEVVGQNPDRFCVRGFNLQFEPVSVFAKVKGPETGYWGLAEPAGFTTPEGYRKLFFPEANGGGAYYEKIG